MAFHSKSEHPRGLTDRDFEAVFTPDGPVVFTFHCRNRPFISLALSTMLSRQGRTPGPRRNPLGD